jgi:hypothetical protein
MAGIYIHLIAPLRFGVNFSISSPFPKHVLVIRYHHPRSDLSVVDDSRRHNNLFCVSWTSFQVSGPRLAAATLCYEFYYDIICEGRYSWKIRELHEQYGLLGQFFMNMKTDTDGIRTYYTNQSL